AETTITTPGSVDVQVRVSALTPGSYGGTITLTPNSGTPVSVRVSVVANPALPPLDAANITNSASFERGSLSPGSLFTIFAPNLAADPARATRVPWPTSLNGVTVKINSVAAPVSYLSASQLNAQVPQDAQPGTASLVIESNGASSGVVPVNIAQ